MRNRGLTALLFVIICALPLAAEPTYVIDSPTTGMLDYGSYNLNFRLFSEGGILTRLNFGVFKMENLGSGWEASRVIGSMGAAVSPPALYIKLRPFTGTQSLPSLAIGYDGQGYLYDRDNNEFSQKEKGIFIVLGREVFMPGFILNVGGNIADFKNNTVCGFANCSFTIEDTLTILAEYDNINVMPENRLNLGLRFFVTEDLGIELCGRDIGAAGRSAERIIMVNYLGRF